MGRVARRPAKGSPIVSNQGGHGSGLPWAGVSAACALLLVLISLSSEARAQAAATDTIPDGPPIARSDTITDELTGESAALLPCRRTEGAGCVSKAMQAYRIPPEASIKVDGRLDDEVWGSATFSSDFVQREPVEGAPPTERTEVAFAYDGKNLYVGARMYSEDPEAIRAVMTRRDSDGNSERLIVSLDG